MLQGDNNVTKAEAAKANKTAADDFPAPASVKAHMVNVTASAVVAFVPTQNGTNNERSSARVAIRADYEFRSENNKTGKGIHSSTSQLNVSTFCGLQCCTPPLFR